MHHKIIKAETCYQFVNGEVYRSRRDAKQQYIRIKREYKTDWSYKLRRRLKKPKQIVQAVKIFFDNDNIAVKISGLDTLRNSCRRRFAKLDVHCIQNIVVSSSGIPNIDYRRIISIEYKFNER